MAADTSADAQSLAGRVALVTGSTSGIGLGIARALAAAGCDIMLNGFGDPTEIETLRAEMTGAYGVRVAYDGADLAVPERVVALVAGTHAELGGLDILVNNAGIQHTATIAAFPAARWDAVIAINLSAAFHAMQAAIPGMTARGWGRIVNIASAHGLVGSAQKSAYVAAKHGLIGLTKVGAIELANTGVTVNAICPGWVLTPLVQTQLDARAVADGAPIDAVRHALLTEKQPMAQFTTPEAIGGLVLFLCSDAARTMTGTPVSMDGGWVAT
ncbi:MAG: 3-hydroxybutyrate dehydrogenase [Gemmatimonadaceae bacterium]|nr:3-hydroxybutyrate dehydrogenase [Acetobacteraceae bacterium]